MTYRILPLAAAGAALLLSACDRPAMQEPAVAESAAAGDAAEPAAEEAAVVAEGNGFTVTHAALRLPGNPASPGAAYFTLTAGDEAGELTGVSSPDAGRAEIHASRLVDGMMTMEAVEAVPVPRNASVELRPGGLHVMLFDIAPAAREAGRARLTLRFADGGTVDVEATTAAMEQQTARDAGAGQAAHDAH